MNKPDTEQNVALESTRTKCWQIIAEIFASILCVALFIDMLSLAFGGVFSLLVFALIPSVFAFPIIIGKLKLLLIPIGILLIACTILFIIGYPEAILFFGIFWVFLIGFGAIAGVFIKWILLRKNKKVNKIIISIPVLLSVSIIALFISNPLRLPSPILRVYIQRHTPIGTHIDDVVEIIRGNEDWWLRYASRTAGVRRHNFLGNSYVVGDKYAVALVGSYFPGSIQVFFLPTRVDIYWVFDEDGKLFRIFVQRGISL